MPDILERLEKFALYSAAEQREVLDYAMSEIRNSRHTMELMGREVERLEAAVVKDLPVIDPPDSVKITPGKIRLPGTDVVRDMTEDEIATAFGANQVIEEPTAEEVAAIVQAEAEVQHERPIEVEDVVIEEPITESQKKIYEHIITGETGSDGTLDMTGMLGTEEPAFIEEQELVTVKEEPKPVIIKEGQELAANIPDEFYTPDEAEAPTKEGPEAAGDAAGDNNPRAGQVGGPDSDTHISESRGDAEGAR
jgi:hypothetical protein|tara:strand:+ start:12808 stop:13560 length:753 start_codon:yes stop_codon:yes gene_type:complete